VEKARSERRHVDQRRATDGGGEVDGIRGLAEHVANSLDTDDDEGDGRRTRTSRVYRLYNRCSTKYVRIAGKRVDACAPQEDIYSA